VTHFVGLVDMNHLSVCVSSTLINVGNAVRGNTRLRGVSSVAAVFPELMQRCVSNDTEGELSSDFGN
jgi:hypothetical protein